MFGFGHDNTRKQELFVNFDLLEPKTQFHHGSILVHILAQYRNKILYHHFVQQNNEIPEFNKPIMKINNKFTSTNFQ